MDLIQLRTLMHVAELGSVSKAADRMGIAQPALSRQIRRLETELRAPLFIRHGRGMVLTDFGRRVLGLSANIFSSLDEIHQLARDERGSLQGRVRFGMTPTVASIITVPLSRMVRDTHPRLGLSITTGFSGHLLDWLKRGEIECCVAYDPAETISLRTRPVLEEALLLVGSATRGLTMSRPWDFARLADEPLVLPSALHGLRGVVDACAARAGVKLAPLIEADSLEALIGLVREDFGMTILPLAPLYERIAAGILSLAPLHNPEPRRRVVMAYNSDRPLSDATAAVCDMFLHSAAALVEGGVWSGKVIAPNREEESQSRQ